MSTQDDALSGAGLDEIIDDYLDGDATSEQVQSLWRAVEREPAAASRLVRRAQLHILLRQSTRPPADLRPEPHAPAARTDDIRRPRRVRRAVAATLFLAAAALAAWTIRRRGSEPTAQRRPAAADRGLPSAGEPSAPAQAAGRSAGSSGPAPVPSRAEATRSRSAGLRALMVVGTVPLGQPDALVRARLERLALDVQLARAAAVEPAQADGCALVYVSSSISSRDLGARLRDVPVPMVVSEAWLLDDLAMTGLPANSDGLTNWDHTRVRIVAPGHPLAAGLEDLVEIASAPVRVAWGMPLPTAIGIATLPRYGDRYALFAYEKGAEMAGLRAPARRVSVFLSEESPPSLTPEAWDLFDAAVKWAMGPAE